MLKCFAVIIAALAVMNVDLFAQKTVYTYPAITADCADTTGEVTVFLDTLATGVWDDGGMIALHLGVESANISGKTASLTLKVKVDGQTLVTLNGESVMSSSSRGKSWRGITLKRVDTTIQTLASGGLVPMSTFTIGQAFVSKNSFPAVLTGLNFATDKVIKVTAQWSIKHENIYFKVRDGFIMVVN